MLCGTVEELSAALAYIRGGPAHAAVYVPCGVEDCDGTCPGGHVKSGHVPVFAPRGLRGGRGGVREGVLSMRGDFDLPPVPEKQQQPAPREQEDGSAVVDRAKQREAEMLFAYSPPRGAEATAAEIEELLAKMASVVEGEASQPPSSAPTPLPTLPPTAREAEMDTGGPAPVRRNSRSERNRKPKLKRIQFKLNDVRFSVAISCVMFPMRSPCVVMRVPAG